MKWNLWLLMLLPLQCMAFSSAPRSLPSTIPLPAKVNCELVGEKLVLANQTVTLPATGQFVLESHLLTKEDGAGWPTTITDRIDTHLKRSCEALKMADCKAIYSSTYHRQWTPAEGGRIGQGSVGELRPTVLEEMWSGNMMWTGKNKPKPGTRFLAQANGKSVAVVMGFETGPKDKKWLGGLQGEVLWALKATSKTAIRFGRLKDQGVTPGPVDCK